MEKFKIKKGKERKRNNIYETSSNQYIKIVLSNKERCLLYTKFLLLLNDVYLETPGNSKKSYIPYDAVFKKICRCFSITKNQAFEILFFLREFGLIDIVGYRGIRLNYKFIRKEVKKNEK